jgi:copper(I)-binding protein
MNRILKGAFALLFLASPLTALAHDTGAHAVVTAGALQITGAFSRATLPNAPVGAGYITIINTGTTDDTLVSATSPVAGITQIHEMKLEGDVMKMTELPDGIVIPAGQTVTLAPGGLHIMFMELTQPLVEGTLVPVTLTFATAGTVEIELEVGTINADMTGH